MTIFVCGDSTAASYKPEEAPITGWGQCLTEFVGNNPVVNCAAGGRSTKSFLAEGRLVSVEEQIRPGDLVLIQFTHNDMSDLVWRHTDPWTGFVNNLSIFVDTALLHKARPVLMTPICMRSWRDGALLECHGEYPRAIRWLAANRGVPLIDMYQKTRELVVRLGDEESKKLYLHVEKGIYPRYPDGQQDDVHTQKAGALAYAKIAAEELRRLGLI